MLITVRSTKPSGESSPVYSCRAISSLGVMWYGFLRLFLKLFIGYHDKGYDDVFCVLYTIFHTIVSADGDIGTFLPAVV